MIYKSINRGKSNLTNAKRSTNTETKKGEELGFFSNENPPPCAPPMLSALVENSIWKSLLAAAVSWDYFGLSQVTLKIALPAHNYPKN